MPLLFIIFVNNFPEDTKNHKVAMFADDNSYLCNGATTHEAVKNAQLLLDLVVNGSKQINYY